MKNCFVKLILAFICIFIDKTYQWNISESSNLRVLSRKKRIVGGQSIDIKDYPWACQLLHANNENYFCACCIISTLHVITAAHCFYEFGAMTVPPVLVRAGSSYMAEGQVRALRTLRCHEEFAGGLSVKHDLAMILLTDAFKFDKKVQKAKLPPPHFELQHNVWLAIVGWGETSEGGDINRNGKLSVVGMNTIDLHTCKTRLMNSSINPEAKELTMLHPHVENICLSHYQTSRKVGPCRADSGGPIGRDNVVYGIAAWGYGCGRPFSPYIAVKLSKYIDWINQTKDALASDGEESSTTPMIMWIVFALVLLICFVAYVSFMNQYEEMNLCCNPEAEDNSFCQDISF